MPEVGAPELLIVLVVVLLVFGGSRVAELGGSMGKGIREFKRAIKEDEVETEVTPASSSLGLASPPANPQSSLSCPRCGLQNARNARYCNECGADVADALGSAQT